jgi:hypothetical protein
MKVIASVAMTSGILLTFVNTKFTVEGLFNSKWGQTLIIGAMTSDQCFRLHTYNDAK